MANSNDSPVSECPVCGCTDLHVLISTPQVPVHCNLLWTEREAALGAPRGDVRLAYCQDCGHITNVAFEPELMAYTQDYENSLHFSPCFQSYAESLAASLVERYDLYDKDIIEIGSGQGDFLRLLCDIGGNRGLGFDPAYVPEPDRANGEERVTFIQETYDERYRDYQADLICSRHVLEHIPNPIELLSGVRRTIGNRQGTVVFFEVPNAQHTLGELAIWDIIYEHCSYFCGHSLAYAFSRSGFRVVDVSETFGHQFLSIEALPEREQGGRPANRSSGLDRMAEDVAAFGRAYRDKVGTWQRELEQMAQAGRRVVVWGAGSKGVTFLNILKAQDQIEYVVDINPRKEGMHIAGTGQQIVSPPFLRGYQPDVLIVMNPIYVGEIEQLVEGLGLRVELVTA